MTNEFFPHSSEVTPEEKKLWNRQSSLLSECHQINAFEHEGRIYLGHNVTAVKNFIKNNPTPADFGVWLQKNYKEITHK